MSKRNALRQGDPHSSESIAWTIDSYGVIQPETLSEIVDWLSKHEDEYTYKVAYETLVGERVEVGADGIYVEPAHPIIVVNRKGSAIEKIIDNEHDAQNTLANIRNKDFPKNKQGQ